MVSGSSTAWNGERVRTWLEGRLAAAKLDQAAADKRGYAARNDYDKAAAEEWVCRALIVGGRSDDRTAFADQLKALLAQDDYPVTGIDDDQLFELTVRANLRKLVRMTKANDGFANILRYQG